MLMIHNPPFFIANIVAAIDQSTDGCFNQDQDLP